MRTDQKELLDDWSKPLASIYDRLQGTDDDDLERLRLACLAATGTNCWFIAKETSAILLPIVHQLQRERRHAKEKHENRDRPNLTR